MTAENQIGAGLAAERKQPIRLEPKFVERVWGRKELAPLYPNAAVNIGEVWFTPGPEFPLLVKFLFTSEKLSVQVHPNDEYASVHENSRGKTEMWHILDAEPDSTIALGLKENVTCDRFRAAIEAGEVEDLLNWVPVKAGDTYFAKAGVIHAIGAGVTLCEIQQNSDVTYRLYDYDRGRDLHLEKGLQVSETSIYEGRREFPVSCQHFKTELLEGCEMMAGAPLSCDHLLVGVGGSLEVNGEPLRAGEVWFVPEGSAAVSLANCEGTRVLRVSCSE